MKSMYMDVDAMRIIKKKILQLKAEILRDIRPPMTTVAGLHRNWRSHSADEFYALFGDSAGNIKNIAEKLDELADEIGDEIRNWKRMADRLSD